MICSRKAAAGVTHLLSLLSQLCIVFTMNICNKESTAECNQWQYSRNKVKCLLPGAFGQYTVCLIWICHEEQDINLSCVSFRHGCKFVVCDQRQLIWGERGTALTRAAHSMLQECPLDLLDHDVVKCECPFLLCEEKRRETFCIEHVTAASFAHCLPCLETANIQ